MGLTYKGKIRGEFDVNVAGANLLGWIHCKASVPDTYAPYPDSTYARVPFEATKEKATGMGKLLQNLSLESRLLMLTPEITPLFGGDGNDWLDFVEEWVQFLLTCGGYEAE